MLASVPFWQSSFYTGPFSAAYPGAGDLSMFVAAGVSVVLYLLTYRLRPLWVREDAAAPGARAEEPAAVAGS